MEENSSITELENMFNEAWTNGFVDGYISIVRKEPKYKEHIAGYEGALLEEYESGYFSAIQDGEKWTCKYAYAKGYLDGWEASKQEWEDFAYLSFWISEYTGILLSKYNSGYYNGFFDGLTKQRDYEWALGFLNRIRIAPNNLFGNSCHDDHGELLYPVAYEEGYEMAKTFYQLDSIAIAEKEINFSHKIQWIIGYIDGNHNREERFGLHIRNSSKQIYKVFNEYSCEYHNGYEAGTGAFPFVKHYSFMYGNDLADSLSRNLHLESTDDQLREEDVWKSGYLDGKNNGILRYRGYSDSEYNIYKEGFEVGYSEFMKEKNEQNREIVSIYTAEHTGMSDAINSNEMIDYGYDRPRFHAYRKGFYNEKETAFILKYFSDKSEYTNNELLEHLKSFKLPESCNYIKTKAEAFKLGVKSGFTGNSSLADNNNIFFGCEDENSTSNSDNYCAHNIEKDLYNAYKDGCKFGYKHTFWYKWHLAYEAGYTDGNNYDTSGDNKEICSREKYKGFELEAYEKGFDEAINLKNGNKQPQDNEPGYEWTMEDSWDAMTDGMYGEYKGDIDFDKLGF